jgi:hypothetical protein
MKNLRLNNGLKAGDYAWYGDYLYGEIVQIVEILEFSTFNVLYKTAPDKPPRLSYGLKFETLDAASRVLKRMLENTQSNLDKVNSLLG